MSATGMVSGAEDVIMAAEAKLSLNLEALKEGKTPYRDAELDQILLGMSMGANTFVYGPVGSGKTSTVKKAISKFNNRRNVALYVNCTTCQTEYGVLRGVVAEANSNVVQRIVQEEKSSRDLVERLKHERQREQYSMLKVVVLDNIRSLREPKAVDSLIEIGFKLVILSDDAEDIQRLSPLSQSMIQNVVKFEPYTADQTGKILKGKAEGLLGESGFSKTLLERISAECGGNVGLGQSMLVASALRAIGQKKTMVDEMDIPKIERSAELTEDQKIILEIVREKNAVHGGMLYRLYCERAKFPKAERTFRDQMKDLAEKNLVKAVGSNKGRVYEAP